MAYLRFLAELSMEVPIAIVSLGATGPASGWRIRSTNERAPQCLKISSYSDVIGIGNANRRCPRSERRPVSSQDHPHSIKGAMAPVSLDGSQAEHG